MSSGLPPITKTLPRVSLRTQLIVALGFLAALPVVLFGLATAKAAEDMEVARADRETILASTSLARELGRVMEMHTEVVRALAAEVRRIDVVDPHGLDERRLDERRLDERTQHYLAAFDGLYCAFYVDVRGVTTDGTLTLNGVTRPMEHTVYSDREWFRRITGGAPAVATLVRSRITNRPSIVLAVRIADGGDPEPAIAGIGVDLGSVQRALERVTEAAPGLATVVLDESGQVIAAGGTGHADALRELGRWPLYRRPAGRTPEARLGEDENGILRRGTVTEVESGIAHWSVTATWPQAAVRQRATNALLAMVAFTLGALALGLCVAVLLSQALARPVMRLSARLDAIGRGDLSGRAGASRGWHPRELVELSTSIDHMLGHLQTLMKQLGRTAIAVRDVTRRLGVTSERMLHDSREQREAVRKSSGAIVQMADSMANIGSAVHALSDTAAHNASTIANLDRQIDLIAQNLQTLVKAIDRASGHVDETQKQVGAVAASSERLGHTVAKTNDSLRVLTDSIGGVAARTEHSRSLGREALVAAEAGRVAVDETIDANREIQRSFAAVGAAVSVLASRSEAIGEVASVMEGVMQATRLLGLNASIIASEAGDQGKKFSVVAGRVRSMASETASSIGTITQLVGSVQSDIRKAVEAVRSGQQTVQVGEQRSVDAGVRLRAIIGSSGEAERTGQEVADTTRAQTLRVQAVLAALDEVRDATDRIESAVETQRHAQESMEVAIAQARAVGDEVRQSNQAQQSHSQAMTAAVRAMSTRFQAIADAIGAQNRERDRIEGSLGVFESASKSSVEFAQQLGDVVRTLGDRLDQLERELGTFRTE